MKRKRLIAAAFVFLTLAILIYFSSPDEPQLHATFPETLSQAQRKEIPTLVRNEIRRRMFAFLRNRDFKAAWGELYGSRNQRIIAIGYHPSDTNKVWVYLTHAPKGSPSPVTTIYPMTNSHGHWKITNQ